MILLRRKYVVPNEDLIVAEASEYIRYYGQREIVVLVPRDLDWNQLDSIADEIRLLTQRYPLKLQVVVGDPGHSAWAPSDDEAAEDIWAWHESIACVAAMHLKTACNKRGVSGEVMGPIISNFSHYNLSDDEMGECLRSNNKEIHSGGVPIWSPLISSGNAVRPANPWQFATVLAHTLDAVKLIIVLPDNKPLSFDDRFLSSLTTDEVDSVISGLNISRDCSAGSLYEMHVKIGLKAVQQFVEFAPDRRRGHLIGLCRRAIVAELLTVQGIGTMVSNKTIASVRLEPTEYGET